MHTARVEAMRVSGARVAVAQFEEAAKRQLTTAPLVVLANRSSASASEVGAPAPRFLPLFPLSRMPFPG